MGIGAEAEVVGRVMLVLRLVLLLVLKLVLKFVLKLVLVLLLGLVVVFTLVEVVVVGGGGGRLEVENDVAGGDGAEDEVVVSGKPQIPNLGWQPIKQ